MPEAQLKDLSQLSAVSKRSRSALIREAVASYIANNREDVIENAFGLWGDHEIDGLEYQRKLRAEW